MGGGNIVGGTGVVKESVGNGRSRAGNGSFIIQIRSAYAYMSLIALSTFHWFWCHHLHSS
jgi:hypothetical protein